MAWHIDVWHDPFTRDMALWRVVCEGRRDVCAPTYRLECMQHASFICSHDSFIRISICIHTYTCTQETSQINVIHKEHSVPWNLIVWLFKKSKKNFKKSSTKQSKNFLIILEGVWGSLPPKQGKHNRNLHIKAGRSHTRISHRYVTASFASICHCLICKWHVSHPFTSDMSLIYKWHANEICARYKISALQRAAWKTRLIHICDMTPWFVTVLSYCDMRIVSLLTLLSLLIVLNNCDIWIVSRDVFP